jgi:hypothetical protein
LIIDAGSVKPAGIMKTLSGTFVFVVLAVVAIVAVLTFHAFAQPKQVAAKKFFLKIGGPTKEDYVEVKNQGEFDTALNTLAKNGGQHTIRFRIDQNKVFDPYDPNNPNHHASIKTDKVTTSEIAKRAPAGEAAANDPSVTYHLSSDSTTDIKNVLDTFK